MTFALVRMGWPNSAAIVALALLPVVVLAGGIAKPVPATGLTAAEPATSCPATGQALVSRFGSSLAFSADSEANFQTKATPASL